MSVLIKMAMPKECNECCLEERDTCRLLKANVSGWGRMLNCPLIELPDHGRLVDADALKMKMQIGDCTKEGCGESKHRYGSYCWLDDKGAMMCDAINEAPTVIEAERREE